MGNICFDISKRLSRLFRQTFYCHLFAMSLFKKPKKNIQRRAFSDFTENRDEAARQDNEDDVEMQEIPKAKPREAKPEKPKKTLLSFGDEEGT